MDLLNHDFVIVYVCENCKTSVESPKHCGKQMQIQEIEESSHWICWKGEHPPCCGKPSSFVVDCCESPNLAMKFNKILS